MNPTFDCRLVEPNGSSVRSGVRLVERNGSGVRSRGQVKMTFENNWYMNKPNPNHSVMGLEMSNLSPKFCQVRLGLTGRAPCNHLISRVAAINLNPDIQCWIRIKFTYQVKNCHSISWKNSRWMRVWKKNQAKFWIGPAQPITLQNHDPIFTSKPTIPKIPWLLTHLNSK